MKWKHRLSPNTSMPNYKITTKTKQGLCTGTGWRYGMIMKEECAILVSPVGLTKNQINHILISIDNQFKIL